MSFFRTLQISYLSMGRLITINLTIVGISSFQIFLIGDKISDSRAEIVVS